MSYSEAFNVWFKEMQKWEGGRSNHPNDRGGATNRGITWSTYKLLGGKLGLPTNGSEGWNYFWNKLSEEDAKKFAFEYAKNVKAEEFDVPAVGYMIADMYWGGGVFQTKYAQRAISEVSGIKLSVDGIIGKQTVEAANSVSDGKKLFDAITAYRKLAMSDIIQRNPSQEVFRKGWDNRINGIYNALSPFVKKKEIEENSSLQELALGQSFLPPLGGEYLNSSLELRNSAERFFPEKASNFFFETLKDKTSTYSGREASCFVAVLALIFFSILSIYIEVPEIVFVTFGGIAGTSIIGYSFEKGGK